jgi:hypothetical protein
MILPVSKAVAEFWNNNAIGQLEQSTVTTRDDLTV